MKEREGRKEGRTEGGKNRQASCLLVCQVEGISSDVQPIQLQATFDQKYQRAKNDIIRAGNEGRGQERYSEPRRGQGKANEGRSEQESERKKQKKRREREREIATPSSAGFVDVIKK